MLLAVTSFRDRLIAIATERDPFLAPIGSLITQFGDKCVSIERRGAKHEFRTPIPDLVHRNANTNRLFVLPERKPLFVAH